MSDELNKKFLEACSCIDVSENDNWDLRNACYHNHYHPQEQENNP